MKDNLPTPPNVGEAVGDLGKMAGEGVDKLLAKPIPKPVENVLRETPRAQYDDYVNTAKKAAENYKNPTPLEKVGTRAQGALQKIQDNLDNVGKLKGNSINTFGDKNVGTIATKFRQTIESDLKNGNLVEGDSKLVQSIVARAKKLGNNPTAKAVDDFIDYAQEQIYTSKRNLTIPVTDSTTGYLRKAVGQLNSDLKDQLPSAYSKLNDKYSSLIDVRNELNDKLGKEGEKGGALMKRVFSPSDANTKQLFAQVKDLTGVDLVNEATIARYVMEATGDTRQASLLQQLGFPKPTPGNMLGWAWNKATEFYNSPDAQLKRARDLTK